MSGNSQIYGRQDMGETLTLDELKARLAEQSRDRTPEEAGHKTDLYGDVADKLGVTRKEAKARLLASAYNLVKPSALEQVAQFHAKFGLPGLEQDAVRDLTDEEALFRINFMLEELAEYAECSGFGNLAENLASMCSILSDFLKTGRDEIDSRLCVRGDRRDLHGQLDALVDLSYVTHGTAVMQGIRRFDEAFCAVHRANMGKVRAESADQSKRGTKLDVVKPKGWSAPVLTEFLS